MIKRNWRSAFSLYKNQKFIQNTNFSSIFPSIFDYIPKLPRFLLNYILYVLASYWSKFEIQPQAARWQIVVISADKVSFFGFMVKLRNLFEISYVLLN